MSHPLLERHPWTLSSGCTHPAKEGLILKKLPVLELAKTCQLPQVGSGHIVREHHADCLPGLITDQLRLPEHRSLWA